MIAQGVLTPSPAFRRVRLRNVIQLAESHTAGSSDVSADGGAAQASFVSNDCGRTFSVHRSYVQRAASIVPHAMGLDESGDVSSEGGGSPKRYDCR